MKTLYVIRHAKSSWDNPEEADVDRPLNERGKRDAPRMGKRLKEKDIHPAIMITSPAKRAWSTCKRIAEVLGYEKANIKTDRALYHASEDTILDIVKGIKDKYDNAMLFGHNPGLTNFVNALVPDEYIDNIPTCGVAAIRFNVDSWKEINMGEGKLLFFDYPKSTQD